MNSDCGCSIEVEYASILGEGNEGDRSGDTRRQGVRLGLAKRRGELPVSRSIAPTCAIHSSLRNGADRAAALLSRIWSRGGGGGGACQSERLIGDAPRISWLVDQKSETWFRRPRDRPELRSTMAYMPLQWASAGARIGAQTLLLRRLFCLALATPRSFSVACHGTRGRRSIFTDASTTSRPNRARAADPGYLRVRR